MKWSWLIQPVFAIIALAPIAMAQAGPSEAGSATACPVELTDTRANWLRVRVKNTSGKRIVGLVFNAAVSDATERWKWLHWGYDPTHPLREFGWTRPLKEGERQKLTWDNTNLDHENGGGLVLVLTSVLFADDSRWEES